MNFDRPNQESSNRCQYVAESALLAYLVIPQSRDYTGNTYELERQVQSASVAPSRHTTWVAPYTLEYMYLYQCFYRYLDEASRRTLVYLACIWLFAGIWAPHWHTTQVLNHRERVDNYYCHWPSMYLREIYSNLLSSCYSTQTSSLGNYQPPIKPSIFTHL